MIDLCSAESKPQPSLPVTHLIIQSPEETCEQFVTKLKLLVKDCDNGGKEDEVVTDIIVFDTKSEKGA